MSDRSPDEKWIEAFLDYMEKESERRIIATMARILYPSPWGRCSNGISCHSAHEYTKAAFKAVRKRMEILW